MLPAITGAVSLISSAIDGVRQGSSITSSVQVAPSATTSAASTDFMSLLGQVAGEGVQSLRESEAASVAGIQGKLPVQQVVDTLLSAERNLQTAIAVRDKLVNAYQEIARMPI